MKNNLSKNKNSFTFYFCGVGILLTVFAYYFMIWGSLTNFVRSIDSCEIIFCDFVRHYYPMGKEIFYTKLPSFMYYYSAFFAILLHGVGIFSLPKAMLIWGAVQIVLSILLLLMPVRSTSKEIGSNYSLIYLFIFLTSVPILHNFKWGQVSILITLCMIGSYHSYQKNRLWFSSILLALAIAIKYYPVLFLLYFVIKKEFRYVVLTLILVLLFLIGFPSLLLGISELFRFQIAINDSLQNTAWMNQDPNSQYISHVMSRIFALKSSILIRFLEISGYIVFLANIRLIYLINKKRFELEPFFSPVILLLSTPFVVKTSWPHYFVYLPYCQIFLILILVKSKHLKAIYKFYYFVSWTLIVASCCFSSIVFLNLTSEWSNFSFYGFLFLSNSLLLTAVYALAHCINQHSQKNQLNSEIWMQLS